MRKFFAAIAAASFLSLAACATGPVGPMEAASELVCKDGQSPTDVLKAEQQRVDEGNAGLTLAISKMVKADSKINHDLMASGLPEVDTVVVISAIDTITTQRTSMSKLLFVRNGCVVYSQFVPSEAADALGA